MEKMRLYAQSLPITFESWIISFIAIVLVRTFFEQFPSFQPGHYVLIDLPTIIQYGASYLAIIVTMMVILMYFAKTSIREVLAISILGSFVLWIAPIIDLASGGIGGHLISYFFVPGKELLIRFITFFGGHFSSGITLGIQIETMLGIIFCFVYVYTATKNILRAVGAAFAFYCLIFFIFALPSLIALFIPAYSDAFDSIAQSIISSHIIENSIHPNFMASSTGLFDLAFNKMMIGVNVAIVLISVLFFFFLGARKKFMAIVKNSRPERIFHFFLLFVFGTSLARTSWSANWIDIQSYTLAFVAFVCAWMFCVCQNDIYDAKIDAISNKNRPLVGEELSTNEMQTASKIFLLLAFLCAYAASHYILFFTVFFLLVYFIYSNPPLRLKRFVIINSFLISLACLAVILGGFFLVNSGKSIMAFPPGLVLAIIIFFTAVANIRDIKDVEGDRAGGIKTIPVLIGVKNAQKLIAGTIILFFLLIPWYFHIRFLTPPAIIASLLSWYFINQENYKEWKGFLIYMSYLIFIIGVLILR